MDGNSSTAFTNGDGTIYGGSVPTTLTPSGGSLLLTSGLIGTSPVTVSPTRVKAVPAAGAVAARVSGSGVYVTGAAGVPVGFTVDGLAAGTAYRVTRGGSTVATATADASGLITFTDAPPVSTEVGYQISAVLP
ncbi:hypothetical protein ACIBP6_21505 [Nonomuraea terrae]|uniref:hypothetical protein n=1 Tax=Nonomuraea terrae TaxID=2530383 RepID=UPI0037A0246A